MLGTEDCIRLDEMLKDTNKLLKLLEKMAELDPRSEEYQKLRKEFDELYEKSNEEHRELDAKKDVKQFMEELELRDFDLELNRLQNARVEYELVNHVQGSIKTDPNINDIAKMELAKQIDTAFNAVKDFANEDELVRMREELERLMDSYEINEQSVRAAVQDISNQGVLREITMGQRPDYMGTTKMGLGTGQRFHGVLGEVKGSMQLLRDNLDTDNDRNAYFAKMTSINGTHIISSVATQNQFRNKFNPKPTPT